ncbi:hypothetical protein MRB53_041523 [Persea americana]|nr:hypothetical protein MRB53_041523 [Persea americana]
MMCDAESGPGVQIVRRIAVDHDSRCTNQSHERHINHNHVSHSGTLLDSDDVFLSLAIDAIYLEQQQIHELDSAH